METDSVTPEEEANSPRVSRLEKTLLREGVITGDQLKDARERQKGAKRPIFEILVEQEAVDEIELVRVLGDAMNMEVVSEEDLRPDQAAQALVPPEIAQRLGILPLRTEEGELVVATGNPYQVPAFDELAAREGEETLDDLLKHAPDGDDALMVPVADSAEEGGDSPEPDDGPATLKNREYDLRVSTIPSYFGEKAVIRILDPGAPTFNLNRSGIEPASLERWRGLLARPEGLLLVTGPTGSGKSTTLYASLLEIQAPSKNIVTIEDPVEYQFPGIVHVPVRSDIGMTFAAALRSILRQDPDVVLVGEIRDKETAEVALRASMTGHLVLSTLHTNDAVGAISRLLDLGVSPHLMANSLLGVMAQRLVRTNCKDCSEPFVYSPAKLARIGRE